MEFSKWLLHCCLIGSLAGLSVACSSSKPPTVKQEAGAALDKQMTDLISRFPAATTRRQVDGSLPRAVDVTASGNAAYAIAWQSFKTWCVDARGDLYDAPWLGAMPTKIRNDVAATDLMYRDAAVDATSNVEVSACVINGRTFTMVSGGGAGSRRILSWLVPDDYARFVASAQLLQHQAEQRQRTEDERARREAQVALLASSPIGTQLSCSQTQLDDQGPGDLTYRCGQHMVHFREFGKYGWRIVSQAVIPEPTIVGLRRSRVTLLIEKIK